MPLWLSMAMSGSPTMRTGSFKLAWSKVIPFEKLVVGLSSDAGLNAVAFALRVPAKLNIVRKAPTEQRAKASKTRGLKRPDLEVELVFIGWMEARRIHACRRHRSMPRQAFRSVGLRF